LKSETLHKIKEVLQKFKNEETDIQKVLWAIDDIASEDRKYNGWVNYETWLIDLWLTNEQNLNNRALSCESRQELKELVENLTDINNEEGFSRPDIIQDFTNVTLGEIDFYDLFESFEQTRKEIEEYENKEL